MTEDGRVVNGGFYRTVKKGLEHLPSRRSNPYQQLM